MDANELRKAVYDAMFDTVIILASYTCDGDSKQLKWCPGRKELFQVTWWSDGVEKQTQKFTAIMPCIDFYVLQLPR